MRIQNPVLRSFLHTDSVYTNSMTISGTVRKLYVLLAITILAAIGGYKIAGSYFGLIIGLGSLSAFILSLVIVFSMHLAPILAPLYAACQGLVLGALSGAFEAAYPGITMLSLGLTSGTAAGMLLAYQFGLVRATENMKMAIVSATLGIGITYFISLLLSLFGINTNFLHEGGLVGIIISLIIVAVAAFNLVLDFDLIEQFAERQLPKYMEWYGAYSVLVTLIWLYVEIVRLLMKYARRK